MASPGKSFREGITLMEVCDMFPDDDAAEQWFIEARWPDGIRCAHCDSDEVSESRRPQMQFRCRACDKHFSVKTNSVMYALKIGYRKWLIAVYLMTTNLKGVSSLKLRRDIRVTQKTAWHMAHRIREAWKRDDRSLFAGPVEVDEKYVGGLEKNKHADDKLRAGRGTVGKTPVAGMKDRATNQIDAKVVDRANKSTLQELVYSRTERDATVYTDEAAVYKDIDREHETVRHSVGEYVRGMAHANGMESFWSMLQRGFVGAYRWMSRKHLFRYVAEFAERHNLRPLDTSEQWTLGARASRPQRLKRG